MKVYEAVGSVGSQAKARLLLIKVLFLKPLEIFFFCRHINYFSVGPRKIKQVHALSTMYTFNQSDGFP